MKLEHRTEEAQKVQEAYFKLQEKTEQSVHPLLLDLLAANDAFHLSKPKEFHHKHEEASITTTSSPSKLEMATRFAEKMIAGQEWGYVFDRGSDIAKTAVSLAEEVETQMNSKP